MAWHNVHLRIGDFTTSDYLRDNWFDNPQEVHSTNDVYIPGTNMKDIAIVDGEYHTIFDNGIFKLDFMANTYPDTYGVRFYYLSDPITDSVSGGWTSVDFVGFAFGIDGDIQEGMIVMFFHQTGYPYSYTWLPMMNGSSIYYSSNRKKAYLAITKTIILSRVYGAGGGGSGYVGNPNSYNKYMMGYNVPTSNTEETKTRTTTRHSPQAISNQAKEGNGAVRITYLGPTPAPSIKNVTYDGVFGYVKVVIPVKWNNVNLIYREGALPTDISDPQSISFRVALDGTHVIEDDIVKVPLKGNTRYFFAIAYKATDSYYESWQLIEGISYTTGASSTSGIEVVDFYGDYGAVRKSTRMQSAAFNTFLNSGDYRNDFHGDEVINTLGANYIPPTYPCDNDEITVFEGHCSDNYWCTVYLSYMNYVSRGVGYCRTLSNAATGATDGSTQSISNGNVDEEYLSSNYVNTFMFLLDHDRKMGVAVCIAGQTFSDKYISIYNPFNDSLTQGKRSEFAVWYKFLYENRVEPPAQRYEIVSSIMINNTEYTFALPSYLEEYLINQIENYYPLDENDIYGMSETQLPELANFYNEVITQYPLQYKTNYGSYVDAETFPIREDYQISDNLKFKWGYSSRGSGNLWSGYTYKNGSWVMYQTGDLSYTKANSNYQSSIFVIAILDHEEHKGRLGLGAWAYIPIQSSGYQYPLTISFPTTSDTEVYSVIYDAFTS